MRYAVARWKKEQRDTVYRIYVSDALRIISKNMGCCMEYMVNNRYIDLVNQKPVDDREPEQVVADVIKQIGLEVLD